MKQIDNIDGKKSALSDTIILTWQEQETPDDYWCTNGCLVPPEDFIKFLEKYLTKEN